MSVKRESKRRIKKRVLAEAMAVYRDYSFPVRSFHLTLGAEGRVVKNNYQRPYDVLDELLHQCARLDGSMP